MAPALKCGACKPRTRTPPPPRPLDPRNVTADCYKKKRHHGIITMGGGLLLLVTSTTRPPRKGTRMHLFACCSQVFGNELLLQVSGYTVLHLFRTCSILFELMSRMFACCSQVFGNELCLQVSGYTVLHWFAAFFSISCYRFVMSSWQPMTKGCHPC